MMNGIGLEMCSRCVRAWFSAALCSVCFAACGSAVGRGAEFYTQGRYIDAAQVFEHTEHSLQSYSEAERSRYGLYRGATLLALGDANEARHWFDYGSALALESLEEDERSKLFDALLPAHARPRPTSTRAQALGAKAATVRVAVRRSLPDATPATVRQRTAVTP